MARGPEGKIQDKVVAYAKSRGVLCKKQEVGRFNVSSGWPDFMFFGRTRPSMGFDPNYAGGNSPKVVFVEFKAPGGVLTPLQEKRKKEIVALGFSYYTVTSAEYGKMVIDKEFFT